MYNYLIFSIHVIQLILLSHLLLLLVSSGCLDMRHELTNFCNGRVNFSSQIVVVINSLVQTKNWRCCTKPLIFSNIFLKRDQGVRFFGTYRLRNGFSKFGQVDYPFISSDLLKGFHADVTESCEFCLRHALGFASLHFCYSNLIGFLTSGLHQLFLSVLVIGSYTGNLVRVEPTSGL